MVKGVTKHSNNATYSSPNEKDSSFESETEKCLNNSFPPRKTRFIILSVFVTVLAFAAGLVVGFFTKSEVCRNGATNEAAIIQRETTNYNKLETLLNVLDKEKIRRNFRYFSSEPHLSGSKRSKELADEIRARWDSYGIHVDTVEYDVLLPKAKEGSPDYFEIKDNAGNVTIRHEFAAVGKSDPGNNKKWTIPRYFFYSPSGIAQGGLLYVNKGTKKDFDYLKKINITSCNGSVVLLRYNFPNTLKQLKNAYDCEASGVILFWEGLANLQTSGNGSVYPNGILLPNEQPLIFSLSDEWLIGDPLTPDLPSSDGIYRVDDKNKYLPVKLPVQIVEVNMAKKLLQLLQGSRIPKEWQLKPNETEDYNVGPSLIDNLTFHLTVNSKAERTKIYDVIGTVYGRDEPDDWVLVGNHRDAITFGAGDAGSGTACMMELSRGIGELLKKGWKPRRTIKLCSWAAEETGVIGSTEYVEDNKRLLQERAVAYINMDMLVHGNDSLKATGNPLLAELVYSQAKMVADPHGPGETIYSIWKRKRPGDENRPQFHTVGLGSDYIPFYETAGVPSIDLQYGKVPYRLPQSYHTVYDTYHYISMFDPHFMFHLAQTKLTARLVYKLSNSLLIPFNLTSFANSLKEILKRTRLTYEKRLKLHGITLDGITNEVMALEKAGRKFEKIKNESSVETQKEKIRQLNRRMIAFNKIFISPEQIPGRWFTLRNLVLGISKNNFYPNITLAGISNAIIAANTSGRWEIVKRQVSLTQHALTQARRSLEMP